MSHMEFTRFVDYAQLHNFVERLNDVLIVVRAFTGDVYWWTQGPLMCSGGVGV